MPGGVVRGAGRQVDGPPWEVHIAGAGPSFSSVGISAAHIGSQGRRGHRWRHQMGVPQPPKRKNLHISPFLPHTLPLRRGRIQNSQSSSVMLSWSAIARSRLVWVAVHPDVSVTAPSSKYRSLTMSCPGHRSSTFCPKCPGT